MNEALFEIHYYNSEWTKNNGLVLLPPDVQHLSKLPAHVFFSYRCRKRRSEMFWHYSNSLNDGRLPLIVSSQLVIRVHLSDESSKTMMVDERQTVRQVWLPHMHRCVLMCSHP